MRFHRSSVCDFYILPFRQLTEDRLGDCQNNGVIDLRCVDSGYNLSSNHLPRSDVIKKWWQLLNYISVFINSRQGPVVVTRDVARKQVIGSALDGRQKCENLCLQTNDGEKLSLLKANMQLDVFQILQTKEIKIE